MNDRIKRDALYAAGAAGLIGLLYVLSQHGSKIAGAVGNVASALPSLGGIAPDVFNFGSGDSSNAGAGLTLPDDMIVPGLNYAPPAINPGISSASAPAAQSQCGCPAPPSLFGSLAAMLTSSPVVAPPAPPAPASAPLLAPGKPLAHMPNMGATSLFVPAMEYDYA